MKPVVDEAVDELVTLAFYKGRWKADRQAHLLVD